MFDKLIKLRDFNLNNLDIDTAKSILAGNNEFRMSLREERFDDEIAIIEKNFLSELPSVEYYVDLSSVRLYVNLDRINISDLMNEILSKEEKWENHFEKCKDIMEKMKKYKKMLEEIKEYNKLEKLENECAKIVRDFFKILEEHFKDIINNVDKTLAEYYITNSVCELYTGIYIDPETLDLYTLKHL